MSAYRLIAEGFAKVSEGFLLLAAEGILEKGAAVLEGKGAASVAPAAAQTAEPAKKAKKEAKPVESPVTVETTADAPAANTAELREKCIPLISQKAKNREAMVALFAKFGGKRLSDITEDNMPAFYEALKGL